MLSLHRIFTRFEYRIYGGNFAALLYLGSEVSLYVFGYTCVFVYVMLRKITLLALPPSKLLME